MVGSSTDQVHVKQRMSTIYRVWQGIACRLRRRGALVGLIVLLTIGLIEPLACIVHCELQAVFAQVAASTDAPQYLHHHGSTSNNPRSHVVSYATLTTINPHAGCSLLQSNSNSTNQTTAPQPFHEMALLAILLLPLGTLRSFNRWTSRAALTDCALSPHFKPPILYA